MSNPLQHQMHGSGVVSPNWVGLGSATLMLLFIFFPWLRLSAPAAALESGASNSISYVGFEMPGSRIALGLCLLGGWLAFTGRFFAIMCGVVNALYGAASALGWLSVGAYSVNASAQGASAAVVPQYGLFMFILCSVILTVASFAASGEND
jgi:hypothetical protein